MAEHINGNDRSGDTTPTYPRSVSSGERIRSDDELLRYSPKKNKSTSYASWRARERLSALSASYIIDPVSNRVAGHCTADEHIDTVLTQIVSQIIVPSAKVCVVCISDDMSRDSSMVGGLFVVRPSATF
ncbi:hypothetical protein LTR37_000043 [Vermiconidia calcicola]|uniref:Uncharacterized protein n=1 Tax=Vermiconidia calcicola TaxID=1690605 RepID=A0ACC3NZS7_9PEZI|nr:hypothetical protein LTR37_000043 [Vermiconidia calcicola]